MCSTGVGKALILDENEAQWRERYGCDAPPEDAEWLPVDDWVALMRRYARGGYAMDLEENARGVRCVSAPVRDASGGIVAAISVTCAAVYADDARMERLVPTVTQVARETGEALGGARR